MEVLGVFLHVSTSRSTEERKRGQYGRCTRVVEYLTSSAKYVSMGCCCESILAHSLVRVWVGGPNEALKPLILEIFNDPILMRAIDSIFPYSHECDTPAAMYTAPLEVEKAFSVRPVLRLMALPKTLIKSLLDEIQLEDDESQLHPTKFTHIFSAVKVDLSDSTPREGEPTTSNAPRYFYTIADKSWFLRCDQDRGTIDNASSRAIYKLREAVERSGIEVRGRSCLDVGASPGGWSGYLCQSGAASVVAVDPSPLTIPSSDTLTYIGKKVQDAEDELKHLGPFDLFVCDMNASCLETAAVTIESIKHLKPGASIVVTLKLMIGRGGGERADKSVDKAVRMISNAFDNIKVVHLLSNFKERTLIGKLKDAQASPADQR